MEANDRLKEAIKARGVTHVEFAKRLGVSATMLSLWVHGHYRPGTTFATRIQKETGIPATDWARTEPADTAPRVKRAPKRVRTASRRKGAA